MTKSVHTVQVTRKKEPRAVVVTKAKQTVRGGLFIARGSLDIPRH